MLSSGKAFSISHPERQRKRHCLTGKPTIQTVFSITKVTHPWISTWAKSFHHSPFVLSELLIVWYCLPWLDDISRKKIACYFKSICVSTISFSSCEGLWLKRFAFRTLLFFHPTQWLIPVTIARCTWKRRHVLLYSYYVLNLTIFSLFWEYLLSLKCVI